MTDSKEGAKDTARAGEAPGQKRPHATLDLKATEIKSESASTSAAGSAGKQGTSASQSPKAAEPPPASAGAKGAAKADETTKPAAGAAAKSSSAAPVSPRPARRGGVLSHLVAGLVGGLLAMFGADLYGEVLGLKRSQPSISAIAEPLEARIAALEQASKAAPETAETSQAIAGIETRLAKLDEMEAALKSLGEGQARVEGDAKALTEKVAASEATGGTLERLAKLEERLAVLATAAETDPEPGRIQGLAAVTGKLSDLSESIETKLAAEKKAITEDVDNRLLQVSEASEMARSGTQRLDKEVSSLRTDAARLEQRVETLASNADRMTATLEAVQSETASTASALTALKAGMETQLSAMARPADVTLAVTPVTDKLADIERRLTNIAVAEEERRQNTTRVVTALELANLKRAIDRGAGYTAELAEVKKAGGSRVDVAALEPYKETGVPTLFDLEQSFKPVIRAVIDADAAPASGSVIERLVASARSVVKVRKISHDAADKSTEAVLGRMESALNENRLGDVIALAKEIPAEASSPAEDWLRKVEARHAVDKAIAGVEQQLKTSLSADPLAAPAPAPNTLQN